MEFKQLIMEMMSQNSMLKLFNLMTLMLKKKNLAQTKKITCIQGSSAKIKTQETQESKQARTTSSG